MAWLVLVVSGMIEAVWATALAKSAGFSKLGPVALFFASASISMYGLGIALQSIPVGTGYAVWTAIGATTTVVWAMYTGAEPISIVRLALIACLVACVVGLKLTSE